MKKNIFLLFVLYAQIVVSMDQDPRGRKFPRGGQLGASAQNQATVYRAVITDFHEHNERELEAEFADRRAAQEAAAKQASSSCCSVQ